MSLPTSIKQLDKFVLHSDALLVQQSEMTVKQLTQRQLPFVPCNFGSDPAHIQFEAYDTHTSRRGITNERLKFLTTLRMRGHYSAAYDTNVALPETFKMQLLPIDERQAEALRYEKEYEIWIMKYDLRSRDTGEKLTIEELNRDLEEYMKKFPSTNGDATMSEVDPFEELESRFKALAVTKYKQGPDARALLQRKRLDYDIDRYMAQAHKTTKPQSTDSPMVDPEDKFADEDFDLDNDNGV